MVSQDMKKCIDQIEQCVDDARRSMQQAQAPQQLLDAVEQMHQRARQAKQEASSVDADAKLTGCVMKLEQAADRAMDQCRAATNLTPEMMGAVQRAHDEVSNLKKRMETGSTA